MGDLRILSRGYVRFKDRHDAGRLLSRELGEYIDKNVLVLGVPRGGVVVAYEIAVSLHGELDLVLAHKLGTPGHSELAMGSISENGDVFLNEDVIGPLRIGRNHIEAEKRKQLEEIERRARIFREVQPRIPVGGRIVIVTDDGVATGSTTMAALRAVRGEKPEKLVAVIPVGPEETITKLADEVDEMICLATPPYFSAVGQFYQQFEPVEDDDVLELLKRTALSKNKK